jgi:hypothetical protein
MESLNLSQAESIIYSEDGEMIEPGEAYFSGEYHGREGIFSLAEGEKFLGLRQFSTEARKSLAKKGYALPDGSFPIENCSDAENAIHAQGRAKASSATVVAHIKSQVRRLGCKGQIFDNYK